MAAVILPKASPVSRGDLCLHCVGPAYIPEILSFCLGLTASVNFLRCDSSHKCKLRYPDILQACYLSVLDG